MKFKRILPIIVSVSVLACALVPFAVSADDIDYMSMCIPSAEEEYISMYGGFEKVVFTAGKGTFVLYSPPVGSSNIDTYKPDRVMKYLFQTDRGTSINHEYTLESILFDPNALTYYVQNDRTSLYNYDQLSKIEGVTLSNFVYRFSTIDIIDNRADLNIIYPAYVPPPPPPLPPPSFTDHIANVDYSPALVEVLGVLPACLACLVAYASIRKGIGYVHSIISNA